MVLALASSAVALDQLAAPALFTTSPLWCLAACLALVWRRGKGSESQIPVREDFVLSPARIGLFLAAHALLVLFALAGHGETPANVAISYTGWMIAGLKLSVLLPTLILLPWAHWRSLSRAYSAEGTAALVVLFTFFPTRILATVWPWYGQALGRAVLYLSRLLVPGLTYSAGFTPTIHGPQLDITILPSCSGISGVELFDYLFALVALVDWNRLRKWPTLWAYFGGMLVMLGSNALRIVSFVVFGNHGFSETVSQYHLAAGPVFFSVVFLLYLSLTYRRLIAPREPKADQPPDSSADSGAV